MDIDDKDTFPCPECGEPCHDSDETCPSCGEDLTSYDEEVTDEEEAPIISKSNYELDEEVVEKLKRVIDKCIERIACECDYYDSEDLEDDDNEDVVDSIIENIADSYDSDEIIGYIDSNGEKGEEGIVFTTIGIIEKNSTSSLNLPYKAIKDMSLDEGKLTFLNTKGFGKGSLKECDVYIEERFYDIDVLMRLFERVAAYLDN